MLRLPQLKRLDLKYLDLSDNPITEISGEDFSEVSALKELKLNNLWIKEVPDYTFALLHGLTSLQLERNKNLTTFSELAFGQEVLDDADDFVLENLSVRGSSLSTLSEKLEVPFGQLIHLDLQGNLWKCDCNLKWIQKLQISEKESNHLRCYTPHLLHNSKLMELSEKYLVCQINKHYVGATIGVVSGCVLLTIMAAWIFLFVPKNPGKFIFVKDVNMSTAGYSALPVHMSLKDAS
ncbi:slit homolog 1 protein-like [Zerene cesonia]|uniref:slit homolog 1 protein-like n=1 Tax=Zerene cesonia TaxID=33412 RepID=UPI0018E4F2A1|nr:slit homolog 1 protein-like [Zerene cesonia]